MASPWLDSLSDAQKAWTDKLHQTQLILKTLDTSSGIVIGCSFDGDPIGLATLRTPDADAKACRASHVERSARTHDCASPPRAIPRRCSRAASGLGPPWSTNHGELAMKDAISSVPGVGNVKGIVDAYLQPEVKDTEENKKARRQALMAYLDQLVKLQQPPGGDGSSGQPAPSSSHSPAGPAAAPTPGPGGPSAAPGGAPAGGPPASTDNKPPATGGFSSEPATGKLGDAEGKQQAVKVAHRLMQDFGLTKEQAAGVAGNLYHESAGMNSNVNEFGSDPNGQPFGPPNGTQFGYGWAQWTGDRKTAYLDYCKSIGLDPSSPAANYAMLSHELNGSEAGTLDALKSASTPEDAAIAFRKVFERAANPVDEKRTAAAREIYSLM